MRPRKPRTPSCATNWEPSSDKTPSAGGRGSGLAADERERTRRRPDRKRTRGGRGSRLARIRTQKRGSDPMRGIRMGTGAALFVWERFREKESGPDISFRPAYIRGANDRIRTGDLRFTRALLYQLSHVGTRLLAKRGYELYRRTCRFARGKCNFSGERAGIRRFSTGSHPSVAALESRMGTRPIAVAAPPKSCLGAPYRCGVLA